MWIILTSVALGAFFIYWWYIATYFRRLNIPHCTPLPIIGNYLPLICRKKNYIDLLQEYYDRWPDAKYYGFFNFTRPIIVIRDLELIKSITITHFENFINRQGIFDNTFNPMFDERLITLKGDKWHSVKNKLTPIFSANKIKIMFELMDKCATHFAEILVDEINNEGVYLEKNIKDAYTNYINDVIASCSFGIEVNSMKEQDNDFIVCSEQCSTYSSFDLMKPLIMLCFPKLFEFLSIGVRNKSNEKSLKKVLEETIKNRALSAVKRPDMIQLMLESKEQNFNLEEILTQAYLYFFSGFSTSVMLASIVSMELATNSVVQSKLQEEIDIILKQTNGKPNYDVINEMPYLEAVLFETLRFYPNAPILDRECNNKFELPPVLPGHQPVIIDSGSYVWIAADGIHHDPKYYPEPNIFQPDRFFNKQPNQSTFLAFGIGPRSCIGSKFAMLNNKLILFHLLARCNLSPTENTPIPLRLSKTFFDTTFENGFLLNLEVRKNSYFGSGL